MEQDKYITMDDGRKAKFYDLKTLADFFRKKFPEGITIEMPDVALVDLKEYDEMKIMENFHDLELTEFWGKINNTLGYLEYSGEGILQAEIRLKPEDYHLILPDDVYANMDDNVACEDLDWGEKAATTFAHVHGQDISDMMVEVTKGVESLRHLHIEGRPFPEVMAAVRKTGCNSEQELKQLLALMDIHEKGVDWKNPVPEIIEPLLRKTIEDYDSLGQVSTRLREEKILLATQQLLTRSGLLLQPVYNLSAVFDGRDNNRAARSVVDAVNLLSAQDDVHRGFATALREGNRVEVSVNTMNPERSLKVESLIRTHPDCLQWEKKPYSAVVNNLIYLVLSTGQGVGGYLNMENLHIGQDYMLKPAGGDGDISSMKVLNRPGNADMHNLFTSTEAIRFPQDYGPDDGLRIQHRLTAEQYIDAHLVHNVTLLQSKEDPDKVYINGQTSLHKLTGQLLNRDDTRLYKAIVASGDENSMRIFKHALAYVYYAPAIEIEKERIKSVNQRTAAQRELKESMLSRVTEAELYGPVKDLRMRCVIDGKLHEGRPLKGYSITVSHLQNDAALLGKPYLNYPNHFHESVLREMAANTYKDILVGKTEQQQRTRGLGR